MGCREMDRSSSMIESRRRSASTRGAKRPSCAGAESMDHQRVASRRRTAGQSSGRAGMEAVSASTDGPFPVLAMYRVPADGGSDSLDQHAALWVTSSICPASSSPRSARSLSPRAAAAQQVPGRDLFEFPLGLLAEAPALSTQMTGGLWNPANDRAPRARSRRDSGSPALTTPQEQGVRLDMVGGAFKVKPDITATLSVAQASVTDILRTDTDPQSVGGEIPYGTTLLSAGLATVRDERHVRRGRAISLGHVGHRASRRARRSMAASIVDGVAGTPIRLALSTFLFTPVRRDEATLSRGGRYSGRASRLDVRRSRRAIRSAKPTGAVTRTTLSRTSAYRQLDSAPACRRSLVFGNTSRRWRLGLRSALCRIHRRDRSRGWRRRTRRQLSVSVYASDEVSGDATQDQSARPSRRRARTSVSPRVSAHAVQPALSRRVRSFAASGRTPRRASTR